MKSVGSSEEAASFWHNTTPERLSYWPHTCQKLLIASATFPALPWSFFCLREDRCKPHRRYNEEKTNLGYEWFCKCVQFFKHCTATQVEMYWSTGFPKSMCQFGMLAVQKQLHVHVNASSLNNAALELHDGRHDWAATCGQPRTITWVSAQTHNRIWNIVDSKSDLDRQSLQILQSL